MPISNTDASFIKLEQANSMRKQVLDTYLNCLNSPNFIKNNNYIQTPSFIKFISVNEFWNVI